MSLVGFLGRTSAAVLRVRSRYHKGWKLWLERMSQAHADKEDTLMLQAMALDEGVDKFAPRRLKAKVIAAELAPAQISPPPPMEVERRALAVAVQKFPSRAADDCA